MSLLLLFGGSPTSSATGTLTFGGSVPAAAPDAASGSLTFAGSPSGQAPDTATGNMTFGGTSTATVRAASTGSLTFDGAATPPGPTGTGTMTFGGSAAAPAAATAAAGSLAFGGTAAGAAPDTAAGTLTFGGAPAATAPDAATGSLTFDGTATARSAATSTGSMTFAGTATARAAATATGSLTITGTTAGGVYWYVSKNGSNVDGTTWATAWTDLDQILWANVHAGDTIYLDGGSTAVPAPLGYDFANHATQRPGLTAGMLYTAKLAPTKSGSAGLPITISASNDAGHNGTVVIFGGRATLLPEAGSSSYTVSGTGRSIGVEFSGLSYITFDGLRRSGIMVYGCGAVTTSVSTYNISMNATGSGIGLSASSDHVTLRNLEVFDNGIYGLVTANNTYKSDQPGVILGGSNTTIERCLLHDNGQDPLQGQAALSNFTFRDSWSYGRRFHSVWTGYGFNAGAQPVAAQNTTHVDGFQAYAGGLNQLNLTFDHLIAGPLVNQGLYVGDSGVPSSFDNTTMQNVTILAPFQHGIQGDNIQGTGGTFTPKNWVIDHVTIHGPSTPFPNQGNWIPVEVQGGSGGTLTNTIITWGGNFHDPAVFTTASGNWYTAGGAIAVPGGTIRDPVFVNALAATNNTPSWAQYVALDLTPTDSTIAASGAGSAVTSIQTLLNRIDGLNSTATYPAGGSGGSLTFGGTATGTLGNVAAGAIAFSGSPTATAPDTAAGALTFGGTPAATAPVSVGGSMTFAGTATARAATAASGTLTFVGTATGPPVAVAASGALSLTATSAATAPDAFSGTVTFAGAASAPAAAAAAGTLTFGGTGTAAAPVAVAGSLSFGGTATGLGPGANATGTLTFGGTGAAVASTAAAGALTFGGTAAPSAASASAGQLAFAGTPTARAPAASTGSLTFGGAAATGVIAGGTLTFSGASLASAPVVSLGGMTFAGAGSGVAVLAAVGLLSYGGSASSAVRAASTGSLTFGGTFLVAPKMSYGTVSGAGHRPVGSVSSGHTAAGAVGGGVL